jgi:hypothetical protein
MGIGCKDGATIREDGALVVVVRSDVGHPSKVRVRGGNN